jgi:hypothetical protein
MTKSTIWLCYDLGVRGEYEGIYSWLDAHGAKECGDSVAVLTYEHVGSVVDQLKGELKAAFMIDKRTRIYVIYREEATNKNKGAFIFGGRRAAPWTGYSTMGAGKADDEVA